MKNKKKITAAAVLCVGLFVLSLNGCGKKGEDSTAIAITPTPADTASETPTASPEVSANAVLGVSANPSGTSASFSASNNTMFNTGAPANPAGTANAITGTIVAASLNDVTIRTSEGIEYTCATQTATNNLASGITLGNSITVTLASMSAVNGLYTATALNDASSPDANGTGTINNAGSVANDGSGNAEGSVTGDGTYYDGSGYTDNTSYDDSGYTDSSLYDDGSSDYYYYDPSSETYDESYAY